MNLTETIAAIKRLQDAWRFLFADLELSMPSQRQFNTWLSLYGEKATEEGFQAANAWINKTHRRLSQDDLVRYASACAKNYKLKQEAANVGS